MIKWETTSSRKPTENGRKSSTINLNQHNHSLMSSLTKSCEWSMFGAAWKLSPLLLLPLPCMKEQNSLSNSESTPTCKKMQFQNMDIGYIPDNCSCFFQENQKKEMSDTACTQLKPDGQFRHLILNKPVRQLVVILLNYQSSCFC